MKLNYKKLGSYIKQVDIRNSDNKIIYLRGVSSVYKCLIKSKANLIGTDMSKYKVVEKNQFVFNPNTARMGDKIPIALNDENICIVSQIYPVFEITETNKLHPEYLMMWFRRPEFDRYARFMSHGSAREIFGWDEMCNTFLPIPSPEKQREIVAEYNVIQNRIKLNNQLIQKLEETAQAIYKQWFVDFEFPDEKRKPYKSNGGKMVFNEELDKDIPNGWQVKPFTEVIKFSGGGTPSTNYPEYWDGCVPFYAPGDLAQYYYSIDTVKKITTLGLNKCSSKLYPVNTTFITARGATVGGIAMAGIPMAMNQTCYAINGKEKNDFFAHQMTLIIISKLKKEAIGATFEALVTKNFDELLVIEPTKKMIGTFEDIVKPIYKFILNTVNQNNKLFKLKDLLLSKLATVWG